MIPFILRIYYFLLALFWGEETPVRSFRALLAQVEKAVVVIPLEEAAAAAAVLSVKKLVESGKKITVVVHHQIRGQFPNDHRLHYEEFYDSDLLFRKIPKFSLLKRFRGFQTDLAIDLDFNGGDFTPFCILPIRAVFKAGVSRQHYDQSYSIRLQKVAGEQHAIAQNYVDLLFSL
jgi:hypothetical protein